MAGNYGGWVEAAYLVEPDPKIPNDWREAKITARDGGDSDDFGNAVALSGETAVVGAPQIGDLGLGWPGKAYVFRRDGGSFAPWRQIAKLLPAGLEPFDRFGYAAVAIDGETIAVSAKGDDDRGDGAGAVYIFEEIAIDPTFVVSGSCPGRVTLQASGLTPKGEVELYRGAADGFFVLPEGPCVGIKLAIAEAAELALPPLRLDGSGGFEVERVLPESACGSYLQLVDLTSCALSELEPIP